MSNFDKTSKVLRNLDVKVDKLDGYLYVNSQGEIEVKDNVNQNIVSVWNGYSESIRKLNITRYINGRKNIKLLVYGMYEDAYRNSYTGYDLIYDRELYHSSNGHYYRPTFGLPSAFNTNILNRGNIYFNDLIDTSMFKRDSKEYINIKNTICDRNDVTASRTANLNFCELVNIYIPFNGDHQEMYSIHYNKSLSQDQQTILTGKRLNNSVNLYTRDLPYIHYMNGNDDILNVALNIESGNFLINIGSFGLKGSMFYENGQYLPRDEGSGEIRENLVITGLSIIQD